MTILSVVYASAPTGEVIIPCLEITSAGASERILNCAGFEDQTVTLETGEEVTFIASGLDVALPPKDTTGHQSLRFAIENVTGEAQRFVDEAMEAGAEIHLIYREYLSSDLSAPAKKPLKMIVSQPEFEGSTLQVTATINDLINRSWPRDRYDVNFAPGLRYYS